MLIIFLLLDNHNIYCDINNKYLVYQSFVKWYFPIALFLRCVDEEDAKDQ